MGAEGYSEVVWIISHECGLIKSYEHSNEDTCCVCRMPIETKTCFKIDELYYNENKVVFDELNKCYCWDCVRKLVVSKGKVSR